MAHIKFPFESVVSVLLWIECWVEMVFANAVILVARQIAVGAFESHTILVRVRRFDDDALSITNR